MIAASKGRKPDSATPSPPPRARRVSFAEPITEDTTNEIAQPSSVVVPYLARYVPQLAPPLNSARNVFWGHNHPHYAPIIEPMAAPTAVLMGRPFPLPTGLFAQRYMMPQGPHWMNPSFCSGALAPFLDEDVFPEAPSDDRAKSVLLRTAGIGALLAALVTLLIAAALTINLEESSVLPATSATPLLVEHVHQGGVKQASPLQPLKKPAEGRHTAIAHSTIKTRRAAHHERPMPTAQHRDKLASPKRRHQQNIRNRTSQLPLQCGRHFYTYCPRQKSKVFYSSSSHSCVFTSVDSAHVCNRGANRFSSLGSCLSSCVRAPKGRELDRCHENTLFTECARLDVVEAWWFFDGSACTKWTFPLGNCPSQGRRVYRSRRECDTECLRPKRNDTAYAHQCDAPVTATCSPEQVKYPYFADMLLEGNARCVMASNRVLRARRCLIGSNQFDSIGSCEQACLHL
ncbi:uncharacterized protein LOC144130164 [Amblyomma americanum]